MSLNGEGDLRELQTVDAGTVIFGTVRIVRLFIRVCGGVARTTPGDSNPTRKDGVLRRLLGRPVTGSGV